ncbi:MAG TPA: DUF1328 domain-containing protein [Syntrophobacteraceae bacterium]|nr:DUF1328 domain-containing protein [Syntrophobacteraceae bacterium]
MMLVSLPIMFLLIAVMSGILGFTGLIGGASWVAQISFLVFLVAFLYASIRGRGKAPPP